MIATALLVYGTPLHANAQEGVLLSPIELKDEGQVVATLSEGTSIFFKEDKNQYVLFKDRLEHLISPTSVLKVKEQKAVSAYTNKEDTPILSSPSLLIHPFFKLPNQTKLTLLNDDDLNPNWHHVETENGIRGYILKDFIDVSYATSTHETKAYVEEDHSGNGFSLMYGDQINIVDLKNGNFTGKSGEKEFIIPSQKVTFEKPKTPYVLTPSGDSPSQLNIYGDIPYIQPINIKHLRVTSRYGARWGSTHKGTDIGVPVGTPIYAVADGIVDTSVSNQSYSITGWGNYVKINHGSEDTLYAHLERPTVSGGELVKQGQLIGYSGNTGRSTGPHLHFELYVNGLFKDSYFIVNQPQLYR